MIVHKCSTNPPSPPPPTTYSFADLLGVGTTGPAPEGVYKNANGTNTDATRFLVLGNSALDRVVLWHSGNQLQKAAGHDLARFVRADEEKVYLEVKSK